MDKQIMPFWTGRMREGAKPGMIATLKDKEVRSASKRLEPRGNKGGTLKLRRQDADNRVNTGIV